MVSLVALYLEPIMLVSTTVVALTLFSAPNSKELAAVRARLKAAADHKCDRVEDVSKDILAFARLTSGATPPLEATYYLAQCYKHGRAKPKLGRQTANIFAGHEDREALNHALNGYIDVGVQLSSLDPDNTELQKQLGHMSAVIAKFQAWLESISFTADQIAVHRRIKARPELNYPTSQLRIFEAIERWHGRARLQQ